MTSTTTILDASKNFSSDQKEDLVSYLQAQLRIFDDMKNTTMVDEAFEPTKVLKASPNISNISDILQDESSTLSVTPRQLNFNVTNEIISEEPEEEEGEHIHNSVSANDAKKPILVECDEPKPDSFTVPNERLLVDPKVKVIAKQLYNQTYSEIGVEEYCQLLGTSTKYCISICEQFMKLFQPWENSLIESLRKLCSRLYLIGESTQIDQVLEIFARSWHGSNPKNSIGDYQAIHIVCFALLILNSDLHSYQNSETKFTREEFVENTWYALKEDKYAKVTQKESLGPILRSFYDSVSNQKLELLKVPTAPLPVQTKVKKKGSIRNFSSSSARSSDTVSNISIRSNRNSRRLSSISSTMSLQRESTSLTNPSEINYDVEYQKDKYDDKLESLGSPWMIEGILKSESTVSSTKKKRMNWLSRLTNTNMITSELDIYNLKDWKQSIVVIKKGLLKQYSFGSKSDRKNFSQTKADKYINTVLTYNLYSASASLVDDQIISNSQNKTNGVAWVLTVPDLLSNDYNEAKKIVYYAPSLESANNFIDTCNFWAARITSIPSTDDKIVTNAEFGWGEDILTKAQGLESIKLTKWECLLSIESSFIPSAYKLEDQFEQLKDYVEYIENSIDEHNALQPVLRKVWGEKESLNEKYQLVMTNWSEKYAHLYRQHQKFKIYLDSLALAISFRASKI